VVAAIFLSHCFVCQTMRRKEACLDFQERLLKYHSILKKYDIDETYISYCDTSKGHQIFQWKIPCPSPKKK
jgi:hypothetical protein